MNNKSKFISILATFLILILFVACNSKMSNKQKKQEASERSKTKITVTESKITAITDQNTSSNITKPANATTKKNNQNASVKEKVSLKNYKLKDEIVYFYNSCANKVKSDAKIAKIIYHEATPLQDFKATGPFAKSINNKFFKEDGLVDYNCNNEEMIRKYFPIAEQTYSSKLEPYMVDRASCYYDKGNYFVEIHLKNDPEGTLSYSSTCLTVFSPDYILKNAKIDIVKKENIKSSCKDCILKATIDEKTGNMVSLYYYMQNYLNVKILGTYNTFAFYFIQHWSISY